MTESRNQVQEQRRAFLLAAARALHGVNTPAHRLEASLDATARALGVKLMAFATPTVVSVAFTDEEAAPTRLVRGTNQVSDLGRLARVDAVVAAVAEGTLAPAQGVDALTRLERVVPWRERVGEAGAGGVVSASAAVLFGASAHGVWLAAALGIFVAALSVWTTAVRSDLAPIHAPLAAAVTGFVAFAAVGAPVEPAVVALSALIMLLPGLGLTVAVTELASGHVMSGTARLLGAATMFLAIAFGVAFGRAVALSAFGSPEVASAAVSLTATQPLSLWVAAAVAPASFVVFFRACRRDWIYVWGVSVAGFLGAWGGAQWLGPQLGAFAGAFVVGVLSNLYARHMRRPASILRLPGILLLVPGSVGFRSLSAFLSADPLAGADGLFQVSLVAMALVAGLFTANVVVPPRHTL